MCTAKTLTSSYSSCTLKYIDFHILSAYSQKMQKLLFSTIPDEVKGTVFEENLMGNHKLVYDKQMQFLFFGYL